MAGMESSPEAPILVVAGVRSRRSLGWSAARQWLDADPDHSVLITTRSEKSGEFVDREAAKSDGRIERIEVDWSTRDSIGQLQEALHALTGEHRSVSGVVHSVANADGTNFTLPAHEVDADVYDQAYVASASSLVRMVQGALGHMKHRGGFVTYGFRQPGRHLEGYGGAMSGAKSGLGSVAESLAVSLGQVEPRARVLEIIPGYIPTVSAKGGVGLGENSPDDVERHFAEDAALTDTNPSRQSEALGRLTMLFISDPAFSETTGETIHVDGGWSIRGRLGGQATVAGDLEADAPVAEETKE